MREVVLYDDTPNADAGDVRIEVPQVIMVKQIDGQKLPMSSLNLYPHTRVLRLQPGKHTLEACYEIIYETQEEEYEKFKTRTTSLSIELAPGVTYRLAYDDPWADRLSDAPSKDDANIRLERVTASTPVVSQPVVVDKPKAPAPVAALETKPDTAALDALKAAWETASKEQRAAFQSWVIMQGQ